MKPTLGKILPFLSLLSSTGVLIAASWALIASWLLLKTCSDVEDTTDSCDLESFNNSLWTRSKKFTFILQASCCASVLATFLQVCICVPIICTTEKKLKSRLRTWEILSFVALIIQSTSFLLPFTFDLETDSYVGINTFARDTKQRLTQLKELFSENTDFYSSLDFLKEDFNAYFILLCCNIILTLAFLTVNVWCLCCCCCRDFGRTNSQVLRNNLQLTKAKNKSKRRNVRRSTESVSNN